MLLLNPSEEEYTISRAVGQTALPSADFRWALVAPAFRFERVTQATINILQVRAVSLALALALAIKKNDSLAKDYLSAL